KLSGYYPSVIIFGSGFSIGNHGYVTCGAAGATELTSTYRFDPADESWTAVADFPGTPRQTAVAFTIGQLTWVGGGQTAYTTAHKDFYRYNPANDTWAPAGDIGTRGRAWGVAATVNGKAYVGTGWDFGNSFFNDWWEFTPQNMAGINDVTANTGISVYNDVAGKAVIVKYNFKVSENCRAQLLDLQGKHIWEITSGNTEITLPANGLAPGMYMLNVTNEGVAYRQKVLIY
ncbi:MAG TPA: T9SS type A sorting domain-containing protein, partial [Bacteroidia bacterium]|nr:T9SS type A sorting domain-containing protein [Bacteroidia bacterium]